METSSSSPAQNTLFHGVLVGLYMVGFLQIILFGFGIIKRSKTPQHGTVVERKVPEFIAVRAAQSPAISHSTLSTSAPTNREIRPLPDLPPLPKGFTTTTSQNSEAKPKPLFFNPPVRDPLEQKLLLEARAARVSGDLRVVALKLEEVSETFGESPHVNFQYADLYESMGIFDKAAAYYEKVFSVGLSDGGELYRIASQKLKEGFIKENVISKALAIGTVSQFKDNRIETGDSVTISIPILANPTEAVDASQVAVTVRIFDRLADQIVPCLPSNTATCKWKSAEVNWQTNGMEYLTASYYLPTVPSKNDFSSLEPRSYYGYVIELVYRGELIDQFAWPRILASKIENEENLDFFSFPFEGSDAEINYENLLLPPPLEQ